MKIRFRGDKVKITGPNADGGITITFSSSQDQQTIIALLLGIPQQKSMWVEVTPYDTEEATELKKVSKRFD